MLLNISHSRRAQLLPAEWKKQEHTLTLRFHLCYTLPAQQLTVPPIPSWDMEMATRDKCTHQHSYSSYKHPHLSGRLEKWVGLTKTQSILFPLYHGCTKSSDSRSTQLSRSLKHGCSAVTKPIFLQHPPFLLTLRCYITNSCEQSSCSPHQPCVHTSMPPVQNQRLTLPPSSHTMKLWQNAKHWLGKEYHVCMESGRSLTLFWKLVFSTSPSPHPSSLPPGGRSLCLSCSLLFCFTIHGQNFHNLNFFPGTPIQKKEATASRELKFLISRPDTSFCFLYPKPSGLLSI